MVPDPEPESAHAVPRAAPRRRRWLVPAAVAAALVPAGGLALWWYTAAGPGAFTTVPDGVVATSAVDAEAALLAADLAVETVEEFHPTVPAGEVIATSADPGAELRRDAVVTVTVSKGPDLREVWVDGAGMPLEQVENALVAAGFEVPPAEHVYSDTVPAGTVLAVTDGDGTPLALGARLPVGTTVVLTCSDGKEPVTIPDVVGKPGEAAVTTLQDAGLQVTSTRAYDAAVPAGAVVSQSPAAGTAGYRLDTVAIVVSKGPAPVQPTGVVIPRSIIGMGKFAALDLLAAKGFEGRYDRGSCTLDWSQCVVASTSPAAGTRQPKGTVVTIKLTNPASTAMGTVPSLVGLPKYTAWSKISGAGFTGKHDDEGCTNLEADPGNYDLCVVADQYPAAGTSLAKGSTVKIWLTNA